MKEADVPSAAKYMDKLKTRFAPSPTGLLHVGQVRTALFSFALARKTGGTFLLRIEDTDRERHQEQAIPAIIADLRWLGLTWDEGMEVGGPNGPYRQSERLDIYRQYVQKLLDEGKAYYAFETEAELEELRKKATAAKLAFKYRRPPVLPTAADAQRARAEGRPVVVRLLTPAQDVTIHDDAFGDVTMPAAEMDDFVLLKADGYPTYHTANVIDDALMGVNCIVRGQEFLGQTWRHVLLRRAWGFAEPTGYCHLPLILNPDNSKMSKRDKHRLVRTAAKDLIKQGRWQAGDVAKLAQCDPAVAQKWLDGADAELELGQVRRIAAQAGVSIPEIDVIDFRRSGYLPEALINFIALLGWNPGQDREKFSLTEFVELFSTDRIGKTNARFDRDKLLAFNTDAIAAASEDRLVDALRDFLEINDTPIPKDDPALLRRLVRANKAIRTLADIAAKCSVLFVADDAYAFNEDAVAKVLRKGDNAGFAALADLRPVLEGLDWTADAIDTAIKKFCQDRNLGMGKVAQPLRVAVTGTTISPPIHETLMLLGKAKTLARIDRCLKLQE